MTAITSLQLDFVRAEDAGDSFAFRTGRQEYVLRGAGGGAESVELTWSQALLGDLAALHEPGCDPAIVQRVGRTLRGFLESDSWARQEARLTEAVSRGQPVVVTIRSAAAELYALPWELLTLGGSGQHLGELPSVLVRYEWPETATAAESPSPRPEGGRVLFAWSSAGGRVPVSEHLRALEEGARAGHCAFDPQRDVLERATYGKLEDALKAAQAPGGTPIPVLHLLCHGGAAGQTCGLLLDGEYEGEAAVLDAGRLRGLLAPYAGMVRLVVVAACNGGNMGALGNQLGSVAQALHGAGIATVIASRFPLSIPGSNRFSETFYRELFGGPSSVETAFLAARRQLARDTSRLDWASLQLYARGTDGEDSRPLVLRPYRGLLAFQPEHSRFFFGREAEITEAISDLEALKKAGAPRLLVVAGASGTGKSSMVLAGAVPRMLRAPGAQWVFARMRPGAEPLAALESALATRMEASRPLLLVVDQFEEVFTQTEPAEVRDAFARRLWALASEAGSGVSVLITIRVDFIGHCGDLTLDDKGLRLDKVAYDEAHRVFVAQMTTEQLEEAITRPAGLVGLTLEAGLARRMLQDVAGEPGALPLLQDTLDILWQRRQGRGLTQAAYDAVGGITGALNGRADALLAGLDEAGRAVARRLLVRLVSARTDTAVDTRRRALLDELRPRNPEDQARFERILGRLVDERLLVRTNDGKAATVEVAHEALIRKWPRLRAWVDEDRVKLAELEKVASWVEEWKRHGALLNSEQLAFAQEVAKRSAEELGDDARKLIDESLAAARRRRRAQRRVLVGTVAAAVIFAVLGGVAFQQAEKARKQALQARDAGRVSVARQLTGTPESIIAILREVEVKDPGQILGWLRTVPQFTPRTFVHQGTLRDHKGPIKSAVFSPDGRRVVTASEDKTARVWTTDGTLLAEFKGYEGWLDSIAFSPDGTRILTVGDNTARVLKADGTPLAELKDHEEVTSGFIKPDGTFVELKGSIKSAAFSPDGTHVVTASRDGATRVWKADGTLVATLRDQDGGSVTSAVFSPDGTHVVTASLDGTARVWKPDGTLVAALTGHKGKVTSATFSPCSTRVVTAAAQDNTARVWKIDGTLVAEIKGHEEPVTSTAFGPDGTSVVTTWADGTARLWLRNGEFVFELKGHADWFTSAAFSPDGTRVVTTSSGDDTARVWNMDGTLVAKLKGHEGRVTSAAFSPDGKSIVTASQDGTARVWKSDDTLVTELNRNGRTVTSAAFSPDGTHVVTASWDSTARLWKADGTLLAELKGHEGPVTSAAFSPDGMRVVTAAWDSTVRVWNADGTLLAELKGHDGPVNSAEFSPNGTHIVTASKDRAARVWKADGTLLAELKGHGGWVESADFSPDGMRVVTASWDGTARVWKADGTLLAKLKGHDGPVNFAAFSPDGTHVVTASWDSTARLWKADGTLLAELKGHEGPVTSAAFSPDGMRVVTAAWDSTVRVWRTDGTSLATIKAPSGQFSSVAFSPDSTRVVTTSTDNTARVWKADGPLLAELKDHQGALHAEFSPDGTHVVTASLDNSARVWKADGSLLAELKGREWGKSTSFHPNGTRVDLEGSTARVWKTDDTLLAELKGPDWDSVESAAFSPDGTRVVTLSSASIARIWTIEPNAVRQQLWSSTTFCLKPDERRSLFGESQPTAERGHAACQAMTDCLRSGEGTGTQTGYEDCLEQFNEDQAEAYSLMQ